MSKLDLIQIMEKAKQMMGHTDSDDEPLCVVPLWATEVLIKVLEQTCTDNIGTIMYYKAENTLEEICDDIDIVIDLMNPLITLGILLTSKTVSNNRNNFLGKDLEQKLANSYQIWINGYAPLLQILSNKWGDFQDGFFGLKAYPTNIMA